jgi:hypothetical protein
MNKEILFQQSQLSKEEGSIPQNDILILEQIKKRQTSAEKKMI